MKLQTSLTIISVSLLFITCSKDGTADTASGTGTGGSLARFTLAANHLYLADYSSISVYDLSNPANPVFKTRLNVQSSVETIYPYGDKLFIGSTQGMFIYSIGNPSSPQLLGQALHVRSCDPVVAKDNMAYVTLRGGNACGPAEDGLYIYDVSDVTKPVQKSLFKLSAPNGLGIKDSVVFVCRGSAGLSLVNVKKAGTPALMYTLKDANYIDVIPYENLMIAYVSTGLLFYDISNLSQVTKVGKVDY
jgi:hypothetical protein